MGEARSRGTHDERREQSIERQLEQAEVVIFLKAEEGKLRIGILPRDESPNQDSPPVIFAAYLDANFAQLAGEAMALYQSHAAAEAGKLPMDGTIAQAPTRSIVGADGAIAAGEPIIVGPDGRKLQ